MSDSAEGKFEATIVFDSQEPVKYKSKPLLTFKNQPNGLRVYIDANDQSASFTLGLRESLMIELPVTLEHRDVVLDFSYQGEELIEGERPGTLTIKAFNKTEQKIEGSFDIGGVLNGRTCHAYGSFVAIGK